MNDQKMNFKVKNGLKNILGREMITSEVVAIFELVKNSCDAQAKNIYIEIDQREKRISISDDGTGMSKDDIETKWLSLAHSYKKNAIKSDGSFFAGAKGIGRFACDRLGSKLLLETKVKNSKIFSSIKVDWDNFEKVPSGRFEEVNLDYFESQTDFENKSGTKISIYDIRDEWNNSRISMLQESLSKLINPFDDIKICNINLSVIEVSSLFPKNFEISNNLKEVLKNKTTEITCKFADKIYVSLNDRGQKIYEIESKNNTLLDNITMQVFYLNKSAKYYFKNKIYDQKNYGSIFVYKNGFRVYPYGQINFDPFKLDTRKTQGMMRYIGNREVIGCINIIDKKNNFVEVSSRDRGFINNMYVEEMNRCYMEYVHKPLEKFVLMIKWGTDEFGKDVYLSDNKDYNDEKKILPAFLNYKEDKFNVYAKVNIPNDIITRLAHIENNVNISEEEKSKIIKDSKNVIANQRKTITNLNRNKKANETIIDSLNNQNKLLKNLTANETIVQAEITHHISKMVSALKFNCEEISEYVRNNYSEDKNFTTYLSNIIYVANRMKVFKDVILKGNFSAKNKISINLYDYITFYIENSSAINSYKTIRKYIFCDEKLIGNLIFKLDVYDISIMLENFVTNVAEFNGSIIEFKFIMKEDKKILEVFSDTPHILEQNIEKVFDLGFSTKNGTGVGLYQIKNIVETYFKSIKVENVDKGVKFVIIL